MNSLLIRVGDYWWVWKKLGKETGWLRAKVARQEDELMPPVTGWQFYDESKWFNNWTADPSIECYRKVSSASTAGSGNSSQMKNLFFCFIIALLLVDTPSDFIRSCFWLLVSCLDLGFRLVIGLIIVIPMVVAMVIYICCKRR